MRLEKHIPYGLQLTAWGKITLISLSEVNTVKSNPWYLQTLFNTVQKQKVAYDHDLSTYKHTTAHPQMKIGTIY